MSFFQNTCKPKGIGGKIMVNMMNTGHSSMAEWGFTHIEIRNNYICLDIGCGGGANVKKLLAKTPYGKVTGIDYSEISVIKSQKINKAEIENRRCEILQGNVMKLPFGNETFDIITAFETIYFWPDINEAFKQVYRVLKGSGTFMICNESNGENSKEEKWTKIIQDSCKEPKSRVCTKRDTSLQSKYTSRVKALIKTYVEIERKYPK